MTAPVIIDLTLRRLSRRHKALASISRLCRELLGYYQPSGRMPPQVETLLDYLSAIPVQDHGPLYQVASCVEKLPSRLERERVVPVTSGAIVLQPTTTQIIYDMAVLFGISAIYSDDSNAFLMRLLKESPKSLHLIAGVAVASTLSVYCDLADASLPREILLDAAGELVGDLARLAQLSNTGTVHTSDAHRISMDLISQGFAHKHVIYYLEELWES